MCPCKPDQMKSTDNAFKKNRQGNNGYTHTGITSTETCLRSSFSWTFYAIIYISLCQVFFTPCKILVIKLQTAPSTWDEEGTLKKKMNIHIKQPLALLFHLSVRLSVSTWDYKINSSHPLQWPLSSKCPLRLRVSANKTIFFCCLNSQCDECTL